MAINPKKSLLVAGTHDGSLFMWNLQTNTLIKTKKNVHTGHMSSIVFSSDGTRMGTCARAHDDKSEIKLWKIKENSFSRLLTIPTHYINTLTFRPYDTLMAYNIGNIVRIRNIEDPTFLSKILSGTKKTTKIVETLHNHDNWVNGLTFSPEGNLLASGSGDKTVCIYSADTSQLLAKLTHPEWVSCTIFGLDYKTLIVALANGEIVAWKYHGTQIFSHKTKFEELADTDITCVK